MENTKSRLDISDRSDQERLAILQKLAEQMVLDMVQSYLEQYNRRRPAFWRTVESLWPTDCPPTTLELTVQALVELYDNPELEKRDGILAQLWDDGAVTVQKSGCQRTLHTSAIPYCLWDMPHSHENFTYAAMECSDAQAVRWVMLVSKGDRSSQHRAIAGLRALATDGLLY